MENRTARITLLIDPKKKQLFEEICAEQDLTSPPGVLRRIPPEVGEHAGSRDLPEWLSGPAAGPGKTPQ